MKTFTEISEHLKFDPASGKGVLFDSPFQMSKGFVDTPRGCYFRLAFYFHDSVGLPLTMQLDKLQQYADASNQKVNPCLLDFISQAEDHGWSREKAHAVVREALIERHGPTEGNRRMEKLSTEGYWIVPEVKQ